MLWDLASTPFAVILSRLAEERRSGDLQVRSARAVKTVFLDHGRVVFAASNLKRDRLGESLVAAGRITEKDYQRASELLLKTRKHRFGEALVEAGVLDKNEVGRSVARQVNRVILSLFELVDGAAFFEERRSTIPLEYMVSLSVQRILHDGIRLMRSPELVARGLGDLERVVRLAEVPPFGFDLAECTAQEQEMLEQARRKGSLRRLVSEDGKPVFARLRDAYALVASGVLEEAEGDQVRKTPVVQMETGTFLLSVLQRKKEPEPDRKELIRREVQADLDRSRQMDPETWLEVPRDHLLRALEEKLDRFQSLLDEVQGEGDEELRTDIELVLGRTTVMMRKVSHLPGPAPAHPRPATSPVPSPAAAPPAELPEPVRPEPKAKPAQEKVVPPPEKRPAAPEKPRPEPAAKPAPPAPAPAPLAPAPPPSALPVPAPPPHFTAPAPAPQASEAASHISSDHVLMEGDIRMTVGDFANAARLYATLVEMAPNVAAYRGRLARAMARTPALAKQAEREYLDALRLEPDNAELHYQFGVYYTQMKQRFRAVAELQAAVRLDPRHTAARQALEAVSPKDSALTSLKKMFR